MQRFTHKESSPPGPPAEHWPSDEDLAAYIDGNLDQAESQRIVEHLASCEDCYAVYIGAVRFKLETEPAPEDNVVPFPSQERRRRDWRVPSLAAAAVLVAVGGGYYFVGPLPALATTQVAGTIRGKPEQIENLWRGPTLRGGASGTEEAPPLDPAAFQIGVQLVNLQVSLKANQGEQAQDAVARILHNLENQMFVDELVDGYKKGVTFAIANGTPPKKLSGKASELAEQVREVFTPFFLDLGQWVEAGRLAAISQDPTFFRLPESRSFLRRLLWHDRLGSKVLKSFKENHELYAIDQILAKGDLKPDDYTKLQSHFKNILEANYPD